MTDTSTFGKPEFDVTSGDRLEVQVFRQLRDRIRFGTYALGSRLPSENELADEHGVSRPVIRAALSKLRDSGLIVSRQGAGSFVSSGVPNDVSGFAPLGSIEDIAGYFQFRRTIELSSVELAASQAAPSDIKRLEDVIEEMQICLRRGEDAVGLDIQFHAVIAEISNNRFLQETVDMLRPHWVFVGNFVRSLGIMGERSGKRMTDEHIQIVQSIRSGDPVHARQAMLTHIDGSESRVFRGK